MHWHHVCLPAFAAHSAAVSAVHIPTDSEFSLPPFLLFLFLALLCYFLAAGMTALTFLKMDYNKVLGELPDFGDGMTNLTHLEINHCAYSKLPASIGTMTAAKTVNCQGNQIDTCEADFSNLADLDTFNISSNGKLTSLPEGIGKCTNLRVCFFQDTGVMSLPAEMGKFTKIERLMVPKSGLDSGAEEVLTALDSVAVTNGGWVKRL
jgi:Leucine-rich repeat (LRR) protein